MARATAEDGPEYAFEHAMRASEREDARIAREHVSRVASICGVDVCEGCGGALEDVTYASCNACRARARADGPRMHRYAEERVRTKVQVLLACSPALYFAHAETRAAAGWAAPLARQIADALARPEAVIRAGDEETIAAITGLIGLALHTDDRAARGIAALCFEEYIGALEEHARVQRYECRRFVDNGRARLALTVHAVQLEGWAERLRAL
jgi:hypothetical protein